MAQRYKRKGQDVKDRELIEATQDKQFVAACKAVNIPPTRRQYRKWCRGAGLARTAQERK